jgi:hypothetical protein
VKNSLFRIESWVTTGFYHRNARDDTCAICRNLIEDSCIECQCKNEADPYVDTSKDFHTLLQEPCAIVKGVCSHVYHVHCIGRWCMQHGRCPMCNFPWADSKINVRDSDYANNADANDTDTDDTDTDDTDTDDTDTDDTDANDAEGDVLMHEA